MSSPAYLPLPVYGPEVEFEVEGRLGRTKFACDLSVCKGACCTMPGAIGAPILESEKAELERALPAASKYLSERSKREIEKQGVWVRDARGGLSVPVIDRADCVFVTYEGDVALCAIEQAYRNGELEGFPKPISCHLFPIRIYPTTHAGVEYLCYEEFDECAGGRARGKQQAIPLVDFLQGPLVRALGEERATRLRDLLTRK